MRHVPLFHYSFKFREYSLGWPLPLPVGTFLGTHLWFQLTVLSEKLQVVNTPMASFIRKILAEYFGEDKVLGSDMLDWDRARGSDFRCIAHVLYNIAKYPNVASMGTVVQIDKWLHTPTKSTSGKGRKKKTSGDDEEDLAEDELYISHIHDTFRIFSQLVEDRSLRNVFIHPKWSVAPVEFVAICLLISVEKDKLQLRALAEKIMRMREVVRREHVDIRLNTYVSKTLLDFIRGVEPEVSNNSGMKRKLEDAPSESRQPKAQKGDPHPRPVLPPTPIPPPPRPSGLPDKPTPTAPRLLSTLAGQRDWSK